MQTKRNTKKKAMLILALFMASAIAAGVALGLPQTGTADAARDAGAWTTVNEIYNDDTQSFNGDNVMDLIEALTGERSYRALEAAATEKKTSAYFREQNGGSKNVAVWFGGIKWDAVYLTTAQTTTENTKEGDIILDLWRSADTLTSSDAAPYSYYWSNNSTAYSYPSNMYSTSLIRVQTLNAGGQYSQSGGESLKSSEQNENSQYARFTMSTAANSLTKYLAKPSEVGYQETEYDREMMLSIYGEPQPPTRWQAGNYFLYFPNDAYGTPSGSEDSSGEKESKWYDNMEYSGKGDGATAYDAWKDDYLWLPSLTETGMTNGSVKGNGDGIWDTDASLRSAKSGVGKNYCWLRSGYAYGAQRAYLLNDSGSYNQLAVNNEGCGVRPALHFNLTAAAHTSMLDKEGWKGDTKTYSPNGVTWKILNTSMVEITAVANDGGTSWYDAENHTITADKVGEYVLKVKPTEGFQWEDGNDEEITVTYTVVPDDMTVTFNNGLQGAFNNGRFEKRRDVVYSLGMAIELKLPDPTEKTFPISWKDVAWYNDTIGKIKIQYIVQKYEEAEYDDDTINDYLNGLKAEPHSTEWKDYDDLADKTAREPMVYVVYFKAEDIEGNHNPCYDYFVIRIAAEDLKITLSEAARAGFEKGVEYGDVAHTKDAFEQDILSGIEKIMATAADPEDADIDKTKEFKDNLDSFTFYLRKDNSIQGGIVQDDGDIYTVEDDGIYLQDGSERVDNLPLGTYHLYVAAVDENDSKYLTLAWSGDRPSFTVSARKINVTLTFGRGATYGDVHADWVTATASRATAGAEGSWYAPNEAESDDDFHILGLTYTLQTTGAAPSQTTPAGTYTVTPTRTNTNYEVQFADEHGGTAFEYTIGKATLTVTAKDNAIPYGDAPAGNGVTYSGFVNGEGEDILNKEGLGYTFSYPYSATELGDVGDYTITPGGLLADNYDFRYVDGTLTVVARKLTFSLVSAEGADGLVNAVFADEKGNSVALAATDYTITYFLNGEVVENMTAAGEYTVIVTLLGDAARNNTLIAAVYKLTEGISGGKTTDKEDFDIGVAVVLIGAEIILLGTAFGVAVKKKRKENTNVDEDN